MMAFCVYGGKLDFCFIFMKKGEILGLIAMGKIRSH